jgi:DNA-binding transcriptional regulator YdaS (Cro superfamily)
MFSEMKTAERKKARRMRRDEGRAIKEIARLVGVSPSSVSVWVRDIELTHAQHAVLQARNGLHERQRLAHAAMAAKARARRAAAQQEGRGRARSLGERYAGGCMLYWAEGSRHRNKVVFTNSDPAMARFFAEFIRDFFDIGIERFRLTCNLFADHESRQREIEDFWLSTVGLPRSSLCKSTVNRYSRYTKKKRTNKLPYGTCRIAVHSTEIAQTIYGSIQELAGFDRPEWLDMPP